MTKGLKRSDFCDFQSNAMSVLPQIMTKQEIWVEISNVSLSVISYFTSLAKLMCLSVVRSQLPSALLSEKTFSKIATF